MNVDYNNYVVVFVIKDFVECSDTLSGLEGPMSPSAVPQTLRTLSGGLLDLKASHHHHSGLYSAGILPRRCSNAESVGDQQPGKEDIDELEEIDDDGDDASSGQVGEMGDGGRGLGATLIGILRKPAIDFALGAIVTALLLKGPVQL